jgi:hypothetical protein
VAGVTGIVHVASGGEIGDDLAGNFRRRAAAA